MTRGLLLGQFAKTIGRSRYQVLHVGGDSVEETTIPWHFDVSTIKNLTSRSMYIRLIDD